MSYFVELTDEEVEAIEAKANSRGQYKTIMSEFDNSDKVAVGVAIPGIEDASVAAGLRTQTKNFPNVRVSLIDGKAFLVRKNG